MFNLGARYQKKSIGPLVLREAFPTLKHLKNSGESLMKKQQTVAQRRNVSIWETRSSQIVL